ncbi:Stk1 family PASTA domain-containing Ser/Thr kinase [Nocardioides caldifontis]|uniref:Stk1 family PASTA domain-containing Ser/Thr kinase n=1 Tax=Nocardioides caldifontis TaxID=2588938 RepID=UPI001EF0B9B4|nr:PASTA domain-containing protein [Nocardioides caldifontis]
MQRGADPVIGRVLDGRYRVDERIARGGMATVYRAHDLRLDRVCAVKVMHSDLGDDHDFGARFVREAHSAARLSHPNVVAVTDQGDDDGRLFLVMEHVPGRTLRDVVREEAPMAPQRALALLEPVLLALAEAHRSGLVHRDVKPENVLISDDGRIKVADFGLARAFDADNQHTATGGLLIGTVSYLAPELIVEGRADPRSDVYAAGVLLFEMLTGRKPHEGEAAIQIAFKHVNEDIPAPSSVVDRPVPAYVDALVLRATARERDHRPADAKVLLHQVRRVRAALEAGDLDDPELTADLMPTLPVVLDDDIDYRSGPEDTGGTAQEGTDGAEDATEDSLGLDLPTVDREPTTVIAGAGASRSTATRSAGTRVGTAPPQSRGRRLPEQPGPVRSPLSRPSDGTRPPGGSGATPARRPRRNRRGLVLLLAVVLLTALVAYAGWWFGIGRYTSTPAVINLSLADATDKLEAAGLDVDVVEREFSETVVAGSVISSDPSAGSRILEDGTVELVVSKGRERYAVPKLRGEPLATAQGLITEGNLTVGEVTEIWHEKVAEGMVVSADPAPGTQLRKDTAINLEVSKGPKPIKIPDLTGRPGDEAQERLEGLGFDVEVSEEHSDAVRKGRVISQDPDEGKGYRDDVIQIVVSKGPVLVEVPRLNAKSVDEATAELAAVGLNIAVERTEFYVGLERVVRQSQSAGDAIPKGSTVTVYIV